MEADKDALDTACMNGVLSEVNRILAKYPKGHADHARVVNGLKVRDDHNIKSSLLIKTCQNHKIISFSFSFSF